MAQVRPTYQIDEEIIALTWQIEKIQRDLQDPSLSVRRRATLQQKLVAAQARLVALQATADRRRNTAGLAITWIH